MCLVGFFHRGFNQHFLTVCALLCLLSPATAITTTSQNKVEIDNVIQRLNYGTIFKSEGTLQLSREYWIHTFQIPIPSDINIPKGFSVNRHSCSQLIDCQFQQSLLDQVHGVQLELYSHVSKTLKFIKNVIPFHKSDKSKKQRRALLPFIGSLYKGLFGTATMDDVNILASHINSLTKTTINMANALKQHTSHMSSYMATANKRMDNLQKGISNNYKAISKISKTFFLDLQHLKMVLANTSKILTEQIDLSSKLRADIDNLHSSVLALIQGKLTPTFLPKYTLHKTITEIQKILSKTQPNFFVSQTQIPWYYQHADFFYARRKNSLFISVKFPVTSHREPLHLYKVISYPVPINSTSSHATNILHLPTYFAVTSHQQFYATFSTSDLETCQHDTSNIHCSFNKALTPVTSPSCTIGLFANNKKWIKDFCVFRYFQDILKPDIIELSSTSVLLFNSWNIELTCPKKQELLPGCKFCILNVPCKCTLTTKDLYYSPKLIDCHKSLNLNISVAHPVNLALLHEFFDESKLQSILGDTTFAESVTVDLPNFNLYAHNYNQFLANDHKAHLNLSKMVKAAKKDELVFQSLTEPLLEGDIKINSSWPSVSDIIDFVALGISIIAILGVIFTFLKLRKLLTVITILQTTASVKSESQIPSFIYKVESTPTPDPSEFDLLIQNFSWNHASVIMNAIVVLLLLFCFLYNFYLRRKNRFTQIVIELTTGGECIFIPVLNLPLCPSFWKIEPPSDIFQINVTAFPFASTMQFDWIGFNVTNISGTRTINIKPKVSLDFFSALKAKRITEQPYDVHILVSHHNVYQSLPYHGTFVIDALNAKEHLP